MELQTQLPVSASATPPLQPLQLHVRGPTKSRENMGSEAHEVRLRANNLSTC